MKVKIWFIYMERGGNLAILMVNISGYMMRANGIQSTRTIKKKYISTIERD